MFTILFCKKVIYVVESIELKTLLFDSIVQNNF